MKVLFLSDSPVGDDCDDGCGEEDSEYCRVESDVDEDVVDYVDGDVSRV